jgi:hypothetical protein
MLFDPNYRKGGGQIGILGSGKADQDMGFQLEFNSLAHLVQKLTSYEQRHLDIYQDKLKRQVTLVNTEDAEDSGEEQEVAIAEWNRGGGGQIQCLANG